MRFTLVSEMLSLEVDFEKSRGGVRRKRSLKCCSTFFMDYGVRILGLAVVTLACVSGATFAQSGQAPSPPPVSRDPKVDSQTKIVDPVFTRAQLSRLPVHRRAPKVTLQRALKLAERHMKTQGINLSSYFLLEARMIQYGSPDARHPRWFFLWVPAVRAIGSNIEVTVSMDGKASRLPSM